MVCARRISLAAATIAVGLPAATSCAKEGLRELRKDCL